MADLFCQCAIRCGGAEGNIEQRFPHSLVEIRSFRRQVKVEFPALAFDIFRDLAADIGKRPGALLRLGIEFGSAGGAQIKTQQPALFIDPGGEIGKGRFNDVPIMCHDASFRLVHRCMVARLRCGENWRMSFSVCS